MKCYLDEQIVNISSLTIRVLKNKMRREWPVVSCRCPVTGVCDFAPC